MRDRRFEHGLIRIVTIMGLVAMGGESRGLAGDEATWTWTWRPSAAESSASNVKVEVCRLLYDKRWAYSVEIDDGPTSTLEVAQPLLARFAFTDAPPGFGGGRVQPFVGGAAVMIQWVGTSNATHLDWDQLRELERRGWGVLNHSYWHTGNHWDPTRALKPDDFRRELYWSQGLLGALLGERQGRSHFVFPNGDFHYVASLEGFAIRSASRVGGTCRSVLDDSSRFLDLDRNWLDESVWGKSGDPMEGFPKPGPKLGDLVIDFTHEIEPGPDSKNQRRWVERLSTIATRYGKEGDDTVWSAPTTEVVRYTLAARASTVEVGNGRLTVRLPDAVADSPLTLRLVGLGRDSVLEAPPGGSLVRQGDRAWVTTPRLVGRRLSKIRPRLKRIFQGPVGDVAFDVPQAIAGVRLLQQGRARPLKIDLIRPDGVAVPLVEGNRRRSTSNGEPGSFSRPCPTARPCPLLAFGSRSTRP